MAVIKKEGNWKLFGQDKWGPQSPQSRGFRAFLCGHAVRAHQAHWAAVHRGHTGACTSRRAHKRPSSSDEKKNSSRRRQVAVRRRDRGQHRGAGASSVPCPGSRKTRQRIRPNKVEESPEPARATPIQSKGPGPDAPRLTANRSENRAGSPPRGVFSRHRYGNLAAKTHDAPPDAGRIQ
jgi:hypothetical protein